ncbi:MAG: PorV/PorQ family protein [Candidatus Marinimicrobia bacterium]|nr:PorV/PorQ family protein [Candidatus Neomarinimicrobiota bacterium]
MIIKKIYLTFILILFFLSHLLVGDVVTKTGTTSAKFLTIGVGSRANGIGDAFVGIANDATAMYWNPAGIAQLKQMEFVTNYSQWIADINLTYMGLVIPLQQYGTIGLSATHMGIGEMEVTTEANPEGTGEMFKSGSYAIGFTYSKMLTDRFFLGGNIKYINEYIMNCGAGAFAVDIGTLFISPFRGIRFGVSISNFGGKMQMTGSDLLVTKDIDETIHGNNESVNAYLATDEFDLPLLLRVGLSGDLGDPKYIRTTWAIDAIHPNDNSEYLNMGVEMGFWNDVLVLRAGLKSLYMDYRDERFSLGGGIHLPLANNIKLFVDYAYQSYQYLDQAHKYTMRIVF